MAQTIEVFLEFTSQQGVRTVIPGGPFPSRQEAYVAFYAYATEKYCGYANLIEHIDAFGLFVEEKGGWWGTVRTVTRPK